MPPGGLNIRHEIDMLGQEERLHEYKRAAAAAFIRANDINRIVYSGGRQPEDRHHHGRQELSRRAPGARRPRHRRGARRPARRAAVQGRLPVAARHRPSQGFRARARDDHRRRGKALADRGAGARGPLRHVDAAAGGRQEGRARRLAVPGQGRARPQRHRHRHRRARDARRSARPRRSRRASRASASTRRCSPTPRTSATRTPYLLLGLPAQQLDQGAATARSPAPASAAISWRCGWTATRSASRRWAARARSGSARRRSRSASTSSRISATAPTTIPACWRCASRAASGVNMTYKILFNDAVAMTGGQPHEGNLTVDMIAAQVRAEGVERIAIVSDEPEKYKGVVQFPGGIDDPPPRRHGPGPARSCARSRASRC